MIESSNKVRKIVRSSTSKRYSPCCPSHLRIVRRTVLNSKSMDYSSQRYSLRQMWMTQSTSTLSDASSTVPDLTLLSQAYTPSCTWIKRLYLRLWISYRYIKRVISLNMGMHSRRLRRRSICSIRLSVLRLIALDPSSTLWIREKS